jgi:hypothetical protein
MLRAILWHVLMLLWLAALAFGVWWMWPTFVKLNVNADFVSGALWLAIGALAWIVALNHGRARYWQRM